MKDPDLLGTPNYTIHSSECCLVERTGFVVFKYLAAVVALLIYLSIFAPKAVHQIKIDGSIVITPTSMMGVFLIVLIPRAVAIGMNLIGEEIKARYIVNEAPVELRLHDECAVKYAPDERFDVFIQMPYESIRQCEYRVAVNILAFTGNFRQVSFFSEDKQHTKPIYKQVATVYLPIDPCKLSEITNHSPIVIYKAETPAINN